MYENRRIKNVCVKCGQSGHYQKDCLVEGTTSNKFGLNQIRKQALPYNITEDILQCRANITLGQVYNESSNQRDILHKSIKRTREN